MGNYVCFNPKVDGEGLVNDDEQDTPPKAGGSDDASSSPSPSESISSVNKPSHATSSNQNGAHASPAAPTPKPSHASNSAATQYESPSKIKNTTFAPTRKRIEAEIISSERVYLEGLEQLVSAYLDPMQDPTQRMDVSSLSKVFSSINAMVTFHREFLKHLEENKSIPKTFLKLCDFLYMYTEFVNSFNTSFQAINNLKEKNGAFQRFLDSRQADRLPTIDSLLITPVQRIPRYILLLRELMGKTPQFHPDHAPLEEAVKRIEEIGQHVNEAKRDVENYEDARKRLAVLTDCRARPQFGIRFIREGELQLLNAKHTDPRPVHVLLFDQFIVWASEQAEDESKKSGPRTLTLKRLKKKIHKSLSDPNKNAAPNMVYENHAEYPLCEVYDYKERGEDGAYGFGVANANEQVAILLCEDEEERKSWVDDMNKVKKERRERRRGSLKHRRVVSVGVVPAVSQRGGAHRRVVSVGGVGRFGNSSGVQLKGARTS